MLFEFEFRLLKLPLFRRHLQLLRVELFLQLSVCSLQLLQRLCDLLQLLLIHIQLILKILIQFLQSITIEFKFVAFHSQLLQHVILTLNQSLLLIIFILPLLLLTLNDSVIVLQMQVLLNQLPVLLFPLPTFLNGTPQLVLKHGQLLLQKGNLLQFSCLGSYLKVQFIHLQLLFSQMLLQILQFITQSCIITLQLGYFLFQQSQLAYFF